MLLKPPLLAALLFSSIAMASPLRAQETSPDPSRFLLEDANTLIDDLRKNQTFNQYEKSGALYAQSAALRFSTRPNDALYFARDIKEPSFSSLALAAIAAQYIKSDPDLAYQLLLGAQERALSGATSLNYIFELNTLFDPARAKSLLAASRRNLKQWLGDGQQKSKPMLILAQQTIALEPDNVESLLNEATADRWIAPHLYESIQLLASHLAHTKKQWAAEQVAAFYSSGRTWPISDRALETLLLEEALTDLPAAWENIRKLPADNQDRARYYVMMALDGAGRHKEALAVLAEAEARIAANAPYAQTIAPLFARAKERWAEDEKRAQEKPPAPFDAVQIDAYITKPDPDFFRLRSPQKYRFRDQQQALQFITAALPSAKATIDMGYPHHGSPRSVALGTLAQIAALANDPAQAKAIADEITIPELRTFYLLTAYETLHPLPTPTRNWPIYFNSRANVQIGSPPAR